MNLQGKHWGRTIREVKDDDDREWFYAARTTRTLQVGLEAQLSYGPGNWALITEISPDFKTVTFRLPTKPHRKVVQTVPAQRWRVRSLAREDVLMY